MHTALFQNIHVHDPLYLPFLNQQTKSQNPYDRMSSVRSF